MDTEINLLTHDEIFLKLKARGAVEGVVDQSKNKSVNFANVGVVVHETSERILKFVSSECLVGVFRRITLCEWEDKSVWVWQYYTSSGVVVEFLLSLVVICSPTSVMIEINSLEEKYLPTQAQEKLVQLQNKRNKKKVEQSRVEGGELAINEKRLERV